MCIIAIKWKGADVARSTLETCFENNPDGAGYMYARAGKVFVRKGFFSFDELWDNYKNRGDLRGYNVVFHFRIASSGDVDVNNCHPFPITRDVKKYLKYRNLESQVPCLCHNGIIAELSFPDSPYSDTVLFTEKLGKMNGDIFQEKNYPTGFNRFAILKPDGEVVVYGSGWDMNCGMSFSNGSYVSRRWTFSKKDTPPLWNNYDYSDDPYSSVDYECPSCHYNMEDLIIGDELFYYCQSCGTLYDEDHHKCIIKPVKEEEKAL